MPTRRTKASKKRSIKKKLIRKKKVNTVVAFFHHTFLSVRKFVKKQQRLLGVLLIIVGIIAIISPQAYKYLATHRFSLPQPAKKVVQTKPAKQVSQNGPIVIDKKLLEKKENAQDPLRIIIPSVNIDLSVVEADVVNGYWETSDTTASHGVGSASPMTQGNDVIFAHARDGLFLPLKDIKLWSFIYVLTKDHWERFQVTNIQFVDPTETQVIAPTDDETLTLYTCSGFFDEKRLIVTAKPDK